MTHSTWMLYGASGFTGRMIAKEALRRGHHPILAWRRRDPDAAVGHAPHHHPRPLPRGYRVATAWLPRAYPALSAFPSQRL